MKNTLSFLFLLFSLTKIHAQLIEGTPCTATCLSPTKSAISGRMPAADGVSPNLNLPCGSGTTEDNPSWWIIRPTTNRVSFSFSTSNCVAGACDAAVSLTLFEGNNCGAVSVVDCIVGTNGVLSVAVSPCKIYYLQLDGLCEAVCNVIIFYDKNQILSEVAAPSINGPLQICKGATTTYTPSLSIMNGCQPDNWKWTLTPATAGTVTISPVGADVKVKITAPPANGKVTLCAEPLFSGKCPPQTSAGCIELTIPTDNVITTTCNVELCPRQLPYLFKLSDCLKTSSVTPSTIKIDLPAGNSSSETIKYTVLNSGCSGTLELNVNVKEKSTQYFKQLPALLLCSGEIKTIKGRTFSCADVANSPVYFLENEGATSPNCDTVYEMVVQCIDIVTEITGKGALDCSNSTLTLDIGGIGSYVLPKNVYTAFYQGDGLQAIQWSKDGIDIPGATGKQVIANSAGNYGASVTYTYFVTEVLNDKVNMQSKSCTRTVFFVVESVAGAAIAETPVALANPCPGGSATYFVKPDPRAQSYKWTVKGVTQIIGSDTDPKKLVVKNTGSLYDVCLTKKACGKTSLPVCITVAPFGGAVKPSISGLSECQGDSSVIRVANRNTYAPSVHFSWKIENGFAVSWNLDSTLIKVFWIKGAKSKKVKLIAFDACGKDSTTVEVNTTLAATVKSSSPVCTGLFLQLNADGGVYYNWEGPNGFTSDFKDAKIGSMTSKQAGTYTVTVSASNGCSAVLSTVVEVQDLPSSISSNSPICKGNKLQLNASGGTTYKWQGPNGFSSTQQNPEIDNFSETQKGTYSVTVSDASGCIAIKQTQVELATVPVITLSSNSPVCAGNRLRFLASGGAQYRWEGPNGFTSSSQNPEITNTNQANAGVYKVTVTNASGCTAVSQTIANINDGSSINAVVKSNSPVCIGDTIKLNISGGLFYTWAGPNGFISSVTNPIIQNAANNQEGSYVVTVTASNGCTVITQTNVVINALPQAVASCNSPVCSGQDANLVAEGGTNYSWSGPDNFKSAQENPVIPKVELKNAGTYIVTVTDANQCKKTATAILEVKNCISTKDADNDENIKVFPNPAKDRLTITSANDIVKIELFNSIGQKVMDKHLKGNVVVLDLSDVIAGDHLLNVFTDDKSFKTFKILIRQ